MTASIFMLDVITDVMYLWNRAHFLSFFLWFFLSFFFWFFLSWLFISALWSSVLLHGVWKMISSFSGTVEGQWWSCRQGEGSPARRTYRRIYVTGCLKVLASSVMGHGLAPRADTWPASYARSVPVFVLHTTYNGVDSMREPWWDRVGFVCASTDTSSNDMRSSTQSQTSVWQSRDSLCLQI